MVQTFACGACGMSLSDPVDQCPICRDHFFWRAIVHDGRFDAEQRRAFISLMQAVVGAPIEASFLTHGGHLWLPDTYWRHDPEGTRLKELPWVVDLALHQHAAESEPVAAAEPETVPEPVEAADPADDSLILFNENGANDGGDGAKPEWAGDLGAHQDLAADQSLYLVDEDDSVDLAPGPSTPSWDQPTARVTPGMPSETTPLPVDDMFYSSPMIVDVETGATEKTPVTTIGDPVPAEPASSRPMIVDGEAYTATTSDEEPFVPPVAPRSAPMVVEGDNQFATTPATVPPAPPASVDPSLQRYFKEAEPTSAEPTRSRSAAIAGAVSAATSPSTTDRPFFKPLMVFLLTMFLTLTHLTLCYYRNRQAPAVPPVTAMQGETNAVLP